VLRLFVGIRFQVCFTPLIGVLFTFPSRYWFTIGRSGVLSLGGWSPHVQTGFHVSRPTQGHKCFLPVQDYHLLWCDFPDTSGYYTYATGLVRVRSPLLAESRLISFPPATEMFHFAGFASSQLCIHCGITRKSRVSSFGDLRVNGCWHLTAAYRSLPRPSSPLIAKAFTRCP
jgi:hypothetical protein